MEIKLIKRKLKTGRTSLVLEYYMGYSVAANGTTRPQRKFETLEYYLYTDPKTSWNATTTRSISKWPRRSKPNGCLPSRTSNTALR